MVTFLIGCRGYPRVSQETPTHTHTHILLLSNNDALGVWVQACFHLAWVGSNSLSKERKGGPATLSEHQNSRYTELIGLSITYNQVSLDVVPDCTPCPTANIQVCKDGAESEELTSFTSIEKLRARTHTHIPSRSWVFKKLFFSAMMTPRFKRFLGWRSWGVREHGAAKRSKRRILQSHDPNLPLCGFKWITLTSEPHQTTKEENSS